MLRAKRSKWFKVMNMNTAGGLSPVRCVEVNLANATRGTPVLEASGASCTASLMGVYGSLLRCAFNVAFVFRHFVWIDSAHLHRRDRAAEEPGQFNGLGDYGVHGPLPVKILELRRRGEYVGIRWLSTVPHWRGEAHCVTQFMSEYAVL